MFQLPKFRVTSIAIVANPKHPTKWLKTVVFFDGESQRNFMTAKLAKKLNLPGLNFATCNF